MYFWILSDTLKRLKEYKEVKVPIYNFVTHRREERMVPMYGANVIIFEGIFAFHDKKVVDLLDMKVGFSLDKEMCDVFYTFWVDLADLVELKISAILQEWVSYSFLLFQFMIKIMVLS